jgi:hypothetical protein
MQRELDVDCVVDRVRVDERVAVLMKLVAIGEPHADPHRRVQRRVLQHAAGIKAQAQVVRADLAAAGHGQPVVARAHQLEHGALKPALRHLAWWEPRGLLGDVVAASVRFRG